MAERARKWERHVRLEAGVTALAERFIDTHGSKVLAGPFTGLRYGPAWIKDVDAPIAKLIGTYEEELHPFVNEAIERAPPVFVDIGCAEGYYAVGFAKASPATTVFAFDLARSARDACRALAAANDVTKRLHIDGKATSRSFDDLPLNSAFVLSDCEGAEIKIFTPNVVRHLRFAFVIIELHEWIEPQAADVLGERFSNTHTCEVIDAQSRDPANYPWLDAFTPEERALALSEWRASRESKWAIFRPAVAKQ
jgi:hypothetical protein